MWWTRCDVFIKERLAIFVCAGCEKCEMTPSSMLFAEFSSAFNRFKQQHRKHESSDE